MNRDYLKSWSIKSSGMQMPLDAMLNLHLRALQTFRYLNFDDLAQVRQPTELLDKQIEFMIENSHHVLDYMQDSMEIFERAFLSLSKDIQESRDNSLQQLKKEMLATQSDTHKNKADKKSKTEAKRAKPARKISAKSNTAKPKKENLKASSQKKSASSANKSPATRKQKAASEKTHESRKSNPRKNTKSAASEHKQHSAPKASLSERNLTGSDHKMGLHKESHINGGSRESQPHK